MTKLHRRGSLAGALALATSAPLLLTAPAAADDADPASGQVTLWRESFDSLAGDVDPETGRGYTHDGPSGWDVEIDPSMGDTGVDDWQGWTFTTREFWVEADDRMRNRFARSNEVIAVADSDQYAASPDSPDGFDTTLASAPVRVRGHDRLELSFDSHLRPSPGQVATVTVEFDDSGEETPLKRYDDSNTTPGYDPARTNSTESLEFDVPPGVRQATFRWRLDAPGNSWYWAIDSVSVRTPLAPADSTDMTSLWVASDIQGHPGDLAHGLRDLADVRPEASALLLAGDLVDTGAATEWQEIHDVMAGAADITPDQRIAAIGNHESYSDESWDVQLGRFLDFAERDQTWGEYVVDGDGGDVPVLVLGQEYPRPPEVGMSDKQVTWFDQRLDYWTAQNKQVIVMTHFPLGDTVSASWIPGYHEAHERNDELTSILGDHPNAILLTGHTHYPFEQGDWAVRRRVPGGHPDGFVAVNTGSMHVEWDARGENTDDVTEVVTRDINRGLTLDVHDDRVVVQARDFGVPDADGDNDVNDVVRTLEVANPMVRGRWR